MAATNGAALGQAAQLPFDYVKSHTALRRPRGAAAPETTARMKSIRQRNTAPERSVRRLLHAAGARFRICPPDLPGRPDIVNRTKRWCVFVHGCFWHGHERCSLSRLPRTNKQWWASKIVSNKERDARKEGAMRALGFRVLVVWQCELRDPDALSERLREFVYGRRTRR